jgi:hypothetical protein
MRQPSLETDGWCLDDGEARHRANPDRFEIPPAYVRDGLEPGDFAQLIFLFLVDGEEHPTGERMWVIVRERTADGYLGVLRNEPVSVEEGDEPSFGFELPFEPRHVIDALEYDEESRAIAAETPRKSWSGLKPVQ